VRIVRRGSLESNRCDDQLSAVTAFLAYFDSALAILRVTFFGIAVALTVVSLVDWAVRTRRLSPFGGVARFFRRTIDPLLAPVERRVVRSGGLPSAAPWWALAAVVLCGIILLSLLGFIRTQVLGTVLALESGPGGLYHVLVSWIFAILQIALLVRVISSWTRLSPYSPWLRWSYVLSEPILRPLRSIIPTLGMIGITPMVAYIALRLIEPVLQSLVA
jgi:YggT family protein